jgi:hypothetical protein
MDIREAIKKAKELKKASEGSTSPCFWLKRGVSASECQKPCCEGMNGSTTRECPLFREYWAKKQRETPVKPEQVSRDKSPVQINMEKRYGELTDWLHQFDLGRDELQETLPELYMDIQKAIEDMDSAFYAEELPAFQNALNKIRELYADALFKCGRRVAVKIWSELLECHLWVVADEEDMKALRDKGFKEAVYRLNEIKELKKLSKESLKEIHKVKEIFPESTVEGINKKEEDTKEPSALQDYTKNGRIYECTLERHTDKGRCKKYIMKLHPSGELHAWCKEYNEWCPK